MLQRMAPSWMKPLAPSIDAGSVKSRLPAERSCTRTSTPIQMVRMLIKTARKYRVAKSFHKFSNTLASLRIRPEVPPRKGGWRHIVCVLIQSFFLEQIERLCEVCGKRFDTVDQLKAHSRSHSDHRPHGCTFAGCDKRFRSSLLLMQHQHVHTGIKAFCCAQCDRKFAKRSSLVAHERQIHTNETPYECSSCAQRFHTREKLKTHLKNSHQSQRPAATPASTTLLQQLEQPQPEPQPPLEAPQMTVYQLVAPTMVEPTTGACTVTLSFSSF